MYIISIGGHRFCDLTMFIKLLVFHPIENIISNTEVGIQSLTQEVAEDVTYEALKILQYTKLPKCNLLGE